MAKLSEILTYTNKLLQIDQFKDYCPNGLQVQGNGEVHHLVCGVTANQSLIEAAIDAKADALLVHHGFFWNGENPCIIGMKKRRIEALLQNGISLIAYHLPLDAHTEYGNNAQLAERLKFSRIGGFGKLSNNIYVGSYGDLNPALSPKELSRLILHVLHREPMHIAGEAKNIQRVAWCTGAAQNYFEEVVALGVDAFISGEISEQTVHIARESGVHYYSAGHHATERYGAETLGQHLSQQFNISCQFVDIDNPV